MSEEERIDSEQSETSEETLGPYTCEYCSITFRKKAKYVRHLRTHTKEVKLVRILDPYRNPFLALFRDVEKHLVAKTTWFVI